MNKEQLRALLNKIGWDIKGEYPNERIYNHKGEGTDFRVTDWDIEIRYLEKSACVFGFKDCEIYELTNAKEEIDCVGVKAKGNDNVFLQFYNHDK